MESLSRLFALTNRSLRVDDRSLGTHLFRLVLLGFTYYMLVMTHQMSEYNDAPGLQLFVFLCFVDFFFILLASVGLFASAISEEKEEMTLGLLKMAGVNGLTLLCGKFIPRFLLAIVLLLSQIPFVMLAITLGGVSWQQIAGAYVVLLVFLWFTANLGLLASVLCASSQRASFFASSLLAIYFIGPSLLRGITEGLAESRWISRGGMLLAATEWFQEFMYRTTAFCQLRELADTGGMRSLVNLQTVSNTLAGGVLWILAWMAFGPCTRNEKAIAPMRPLAISWSRRRGMKLFAPGRVWRNAIMWKDFHFHAGGRGMIVGQCILFVIVFAAVCGFQWYYDHEITWEENGVGLMIASVAVAGILGAALATRLFVEEAKWQTLTNLVLIPQGIASIVWSKVRGAMLTLMPSVVFFVVGIALVVWDRYPQSWPIPTNDFEVRWIVWFVSQYLLLIHLAAVLSLFVKWGALPITIGTMWIVYVAIGTTMRFGGEEEFLVIGYLMAGCVIPVALVILAERIRHLAAR